jgi:putative ABC transport system substrate-binding protein
VYVDKVLRGGSASSLSVEQPSKFELVQNLKIAKMLDPMIPSSPLVRADEVIE